MLKRIVVLSMLMVSGCSSIKPPTAPDRVLVSNQSGMAPIHFAVPEYPERARQEKIEGWVLVEFTVAEDGRPERIQVIGSEPDAVFDQAAVEAASQLVYVPMIKNGQLVAVSGVQYRYIFDLMDQGEEPPAFPPVVE